MPLGLVKLMDKNNTNKQLYIYTATIADSLPREQREENTQADGYTSPKGRRVGKTLC